MTDKRTLVIAVVLLLLLTGGGVCVWYLFKQPYSHRLVNVNAMPGVKVAPTAPRNPSLAPVPASSAIGWDPQRNGTSVTAGAIDSTGRVWIATEDHGVSVQQSSAGDKQWKTYTTADGLCDDTIHTIAVDARDRVWAGHLRHGVSVFNGKSWKNYDATTGPLGQRIFRIAVAPSTATSAAGDVWIASDVGLARYRTAEDRWSYYTRAEGLPADQATSLSFAADGTLYVGTPCDGIAVAAPTDDYKTWRHVTGAELPPLAASGAGLPSNIINDVLAIPDGPVFAATARGLAFSTDQGVHWQFRRGVDWIGKVRESIDGPPPNFQPAAGALLAQDEITCLAPAQQGRLWGGFRNSGYQLLDGSMNPMRTSAGPVAYCAMILHRPGKTALVGTRGVGLAEINQQQATSAPDAAFSSAPPSAASFPSIAAPPTIAQLRAMTAAVAALSGDPVPAYLNEDWATQGDWVGRFGRQQSVWPYYGDFSSDNAADFSLHAFTGPHHKDDSGNPWTWYGDLNSPSPLVLYGPGRGRRLLGEWNDGGWQGDGKFGPNFEGPDIWLDVSVPAGVHRFSMYFNGAPIDADRGRDLILEVKDFCPLEEASNAPVLARGRSPAVQNPHYHTFLLPQGHYWVRVAHNYSRMASLAATFFDRAEIPPLASDDATAHYLSGVTYDPPPVPPATPTDSPDLLAARDLWTALDAAWSHNGAANVETAYRVQAYRTAAAAGAAPDLLTNWRWSLHLWTAEDRQQWDSTMAKSRIALAAANAKTKPATQAATTQK